MMPLTLANVGEELTIQKIGGGSTAKLITALNGNVIVQVKETRVAISEEMARKIMV